MNRRSFFEHLWFSFVVAACAGRAPRKEKSEMISSYVTDSGQNSLVWISDKGEVLRQSSLLNSGHSQEICPWNRNLILIATNSGPQSALMNSHDMSIRYFNPVEGFNFYGHGGFLKENQSFFMTERKNDQGIISIRSINDLKLSHQVSLNGIGPHDCYLNSQGLIVVALDGVKRGQDYKALKTNPSKLTAISYQSGEEVWKVECPDNELSFGHLLELKSGIIVATLSTLNKSSDSSLIAFIDKNKNVTIPSLPLNLRGKIRKQSLSLCSHPDEDLVLVSYPESDLVILFNSKTNTILATREISGPHGVAFSPVTHELWVTTKFGQIVTLDPNTLSFKRNFSSLFTSGGFEAHCDFIKLES